LIETGGGEERRGEVEREEGNWRRGF